MFTVHVSLLFFISRTPWWQLEYTWGCEYHTLGIPGLYCSIIENNERDRRRDIVFSSQLRFTLISDTPTQHISRNTSPNFLLTSTHEGHTSFSKLNTEQSFTLQLNPKLRYWLPSHCPSLCCAEWLTGGGGALWLWP